jgi:hypothetical protein
VRIGGERVGEDFDRHDAIQTYVAGFVHFAHAAGTKGGQNFVRSEAGSRLEGHGGVNPRGISDPSRARPTQPAA